MEFDPPDRTSDRLTGLLNRRAFWDSIHQRPDHWPPQFRMGLAFIDLVEFAQLNAIRGREVGDAALRCIAAAIPRTAPHEWASRYGGDEFAVLLALGTPSEAEEWGDVAVGRIVEVVAHELSATLEARIGIAVGEPGWWPSDIHSQAITPADAALGQAMRSDTPRSVVVTEMWSND